MAVSDRKAEMRHPLRTGRTLVVLGGFALSGCSPTGVGGGWSVTSALAELPASAVGDQLILQTAENKGALRRPASSEAKTPIPATGCPR
ncbi:hypothetical protein BW733_14250 [Tessaracoccus flavescens]|uniref:Uncharacterized protein n=1 Tax=Tessaracoccus flavescens TaxID=399497 RepID=A0A1Q2D0F9_9ACTN|nr:hypothetical protein BW733_14250 [Tessaracoccus flavescens]